MLPFSFNGNTNNNNNNNNEFNVILLVELNETMNFEKLPKRYIH